MAKFNRFMIIYHVEDVLLPKKEYVENRDILYARLQELINKGHSPVYREVDQDGHIVQYSAK